MVTEQRQYSLIDRVLIQFDQGLRTLAGNVTTTPRSNPTASMTDQPLTATECKQTARLLRVDHSGEVCAQALYQGQALTAKTSAVRNNMQQSAAEENDHLQWCQQRLQELNSHPSYLNPFWYLGSLLLGAFAGAIGDRWSLGFVAETERQVVKHLDSHLEKLSPQDFKSRKILEQMRLDEAHHATTAISAGAHELPTLIKQVMRLMSKIMTTTAYWI